MIEGLNPVNMIDNVISMHMQSLCCLDLNLCKKYFDIWHEAGCKIIVKASHIADAKVAADAGCDVMIVKGWEGGGHVTFEATTVLVPQAVDLLDMPVVAPMGLAFHNVEEYSHLASILPEVYNEFGKKPLDADLTI